MNIVKNICMSIFLPLEIINRKKIEKKLLSSTIIVLLTALFGSIISPLMYYFNYKSKFEINISVSNMIIMLVISALTWIAACTLFWLFSIIYKKHVSFTEIVSTWGFSYVPNFVCIIAYSFIQIGTGFIMSSSIFGFLVNTFFIMLLIWKAIYFFIEMKFVIGVTGLELLIITLISGIIFALLMMLGFSVGIQIPML